MPGQTSLSCTLAAAGFSVIAAFRTIHHPDVSKLLNTRNEVCKEIAENLWTEPPNLPFFSHFQHLH